MKVCVDSLSTQIFTGEVLRDFVFCTFALDGRSPKCKTRKNGPPDTIQIKHQNDSDTNFQREDFVSGCGGSVCEESLEGLWRSLFRGILGLSLGPLSPMAWPLAARTFNLEPPHSSRFVNGVCLLQLSSARVCQTWVRTYFKTC